MRNLRRLAWAALAALAAAATAAPAAAQVGGGNLGGATTGTAQTVGGNFGAQPAAGTAGTTGGAAAGSTGTTGSIGGTELTVERAPVIKSPATYGTTNANPKIQGSNFLAPSFANPYYQGVLAKARTGTLTPGGFGDLTFGAATGGAAGGAAATVGRAGGAGAGTGLTTDPGGQLVPLPRQIAYPAQLKFAVAPVAAPRLQADLRGLLDRAPTLANPAGVLVQVDGNAVVLRGAVRDGDEARLVEGLVRLTPGVGRISNELTYPRP